VVTTASATAITAQPLHRQAIAANPIPHTIDRMHIPLLVSGGAIVDEVPNCIKS
jgi:hypothetical protein